MGPLWKYKTKRMGTCQVQTNDYPEAGGRIQIPVPTGEAAITYNYRLADTRNLNDSVPEYSEVPENKLGFDIKLDMVVGCGLKVHG